MPYIDKEKFRMHIILKQHNPLKVRLTDKEKEKFIRMLDEVPTTDVVERKKGKWIRHGVEEGHLIEKYTCSECDFYSGTKMSNFCPSCGTKMEGDAK